MCCYEGSNSLVAVETRGSAAQTRLVCHKIRRRVRRYIRHAGPTAAVAALALVSEVGPPESYEMPE